MEMRSVYYFNRIILKFKRWYRVKCFEGCTKSKTDGLSILGPVYMRNPNVHLGKNVTLYPNVMFQGTGKISIGDNTFIGNGTIVYAEEGYKVKIGADCMIAPMVYITTTDHNTGMHKNITMNRNGVVSENVLIEDDVWLGAYVVVLKGSRIKEGAVVGAKALVKGEIIENSIVGGIPARILKMRQ